MRKSSEQWLDIIKGNEQKEGANQNKSGPSKKAGDNQEGKDTEERHLEQTKGTEELSGQQGIMAGTEPEEIMGPSWETSTDHTQWETRKTT
jgi:hypothetical protein